MAGALRRMTRLPVAPWSPESRSITVHEEDAATAVVRLASLTEIPVLPLESPTRSPCNSIASSVRRRADGHVSHLVPVPWQLAYVTLRAGEVAGARLPFRADSLLGLARPAQEVPHQSVATGWAVISPVLPLNPGATEEPAGGEMPYPHDNPKMSGEAPRVQPSKINLVNWGRRRGPMSAFSSARAMASSPAAVGWNGARSRPVTAGSRRRPRWRAPRRRSGASRPRARSPGCVCGGRPRRTRTMRGRSRRIHAGGYGSQRDAVPGTRPGDRRPGGAVRALPGLLPGHPVAKVSRCPSPSCAGPGCPRAGRRWSCSTTSRTSSGAGSSGASSASRSPDPWGDSSGDPAGPGTCPPDRGLDESWRSSTSRPRGRTPC